MGKARAPRSDTWGHLRVFANTQDGVFAVDQGGRIVLWNKAATRILGFDADEALGRRCCDVMRGLDVSGNLLCYPGCQVMVLSASSPPTVTSPAERSTCSGTSRRIATCRDGSSGGPRRPPGERAGGSGRRSRSLLRKGPERDRPNP
ncbi:MAG: PAS domain-containing protein [candidate division NC10 bacterium]|nr:PAS domain-containing protein [candidate division NC10 bacterium]